MTKAAATNNLTAHAGPKRRLKLWLAFIILFMAWAAYTIVNQMQRQGETEMRLAAIQQKYAEAEQAGGELTQKIERLKDPEYIREMATKEHGMIMPGEKPIQVTGQGD